MKTLLISFLLASFSTLAAGEKPPRPNIIVLVADDLGWHDLGVTGHPHHRTPKIDQLARSGMLFTEAMAAAPICSASRAALLTGQSPARLHYEFVPKFHSGRQQGPWPLLTPPYPEELPANTPTVASALRTAGYQTAFFGKWHLNRHHHHYLGWRPGHGPESFGFSHSFTDFGNHPYGYGNATPPDAPGDQIPPDRLTSQAVAWLSRHHQQPFLLWMSYYWVHDPFHSTLVDRVSWHRKRLPPDANPKLAHYAAMVETLDHEVGLLLAALEKSGQAKNTLILFTSDNGGHPEVSPNGPLRGSKWNLYQGGLRVPLIARWPARITPGRTEPTLLTGMDLPATILAAANLDPSTARDGHSFLPTLLGTRQTEFSSRPLIWHFPHYQPETHFQKAKPTIGVNDFTVSQTRPHAAIRIGPWKLIRSFENHQEELYHLESDPSESHNRILQENPRSRLLSRQLTESLQSLNARLPHPKP